MSDGQTPFFLLDNVDNIYRFDSYANGQLGKLK